MINHVTLEGYVTKGAETRATQSGRELTKFTLNCPKRRKVGGEWKSEPRFVRCVYWHVAEGQDFKAPQIVEGARLVVTGEIDFEQWEGRDGQKRSENPVNVREVVTVAQRENGASQPARTAQGGAYQPDLYEDDLPF